MTTTSTPKYLQFLLLPLFVFVLNVGWGQVTIGVQDFENSPATPTIAFTSSGTVGSSVFGYTSGTTAAATVDLPGASNKFANGSRGWGLTISTGTTTAVRSITTTNPIVTTGYSSIALNLAVAAFSIASTGNGIDGTDYIEIFTSTDGTNYVSQLKLTGGTNARWAFGGTGIATTAYSDLGAAAVQATGNGTLTGASAYSTMKITSLPATGALYFRITMSNNSPSELWVIDDFKITGTAAPTVTSSAATATAFTTTYGTASAAQTFSVSGSNLTANLVATAPTGFEVSSDGTTYGTTASFTQTSGSASGTLSVRLKATAAVTGTSYNGVNIQLTSTGATPVNITTASSGNTVSAKALTITGLSGSNKVYDGTTTASLAGTAAYSGLVNGESFSVTGTPTASFASAAVGTGKTITVTGYTAPSANYSISQPAGLTADITAKSLTITANNITKTEGATLTGGAGSTAFTSSGLVSSESIGSVTIAYGNGAASNDLAGTYTNQVTPSLAIGGTFSASNYSITYVQGNIIVEAAPASPTISVSGTLSALSTTYGTPSSTSNFTLSGAAMTEGITITPPAGFEVATTSDFSSTIGTTSSPLVIGSIGTIASTTVYVRIRAVAAVSGSPYSGNITLTSAGASVQSIATSSSIVNTKALTITGIFGVSKIYDGTISATLSGTASYVGLVNGELFSVIGTPLATFDNKNIGTTKTVNITGYASPSTNYTLTQPSATGNISALGLTVSGATVSSKTYDGTTNASITGSLLIGVISPDDVTISSTGIFTSANAGTGISVTSTQTLGGADAGNYTVSLPLGLTGVISKANQTITFNALANKTTADLPFALTATASSSLSVTYTSSNTAVATISGNTVTIVGAGTTTITASQTGNGNFNPATSISQIQTVSYGLVGLGNYLYTGTATASGPASRLSANLVNANGLNSNISISNQTIAGLTVQTGSTNDNLLALAPTSGNFGTALNASTYVQFTVTPSLGYLLNLSSITFNNGRTSAGSTAWALRSSLDNYSVDIVSGSTTSTANPPTVLSTATISGVEFLNQSSAVTFRLYPYGGSSTGFWRIDNLTINGYISVPLTPPTLTADATSNTVDNNIDITFTEDAAWRGAITSIKVDGTNLSSSAYSTTTAGQISFNPSASALLQSAGSKSIEVIASGYSNATITQVFGAGTPTSNSTATINSLLSSGATRTITCTAKDQYNNLVSGYTFTYDATLVTANATTTESYSIDGSAVTSSVNNVSLSSTTNASGVATFTIVMPSVLDEADGISIQVQSANGSTNVGTPFAYHELPSQTITFNALGAKTYGDASFILIATGGASGNPVVFTSSNTNVATCTGTNGSTVTIIGVGSATITASQAGNAGFNAAAPVSQTLTVNQKALTISGITGANKVYNGTATATFTGTPTYVGLVNGENFSVSGTATATFSDANVGIGKTIIVVGYTAPSANYSLTQPTLTGDITQASQTISFASLPNRMVGGSSYSLNLNASSGLPITYESSNTGVVSVSGNTVTIVGAGTATITASQVGNNNYSVATSVSQTQTIIATPIAAWDFFGQSSPATFAATTFNSNLDATSSLSEMTRGAGAASNGVANAFSTIGFQNNGISTSNTDYFQITLKANSGHFLSLSEINANFDGTSTYYATPGVTSQYAYSLDGTNFTLIGSPVTSTSLKPAAVDLSNVSALQNVSSSSTVTIRYYASGQTTTGGWRFSSPSAGVPGLAIGGSLCQLPSSLSLSSTSFCNNGETSTISSSTSEIGVTYDLYDSNGIISNTSKSGTGNALSWSGISQGTYYVMGTRDAGSCSSSSQNIILTAVIPTYSYYTDNDSDGFGIGTVHLNCNASAPTGYSALNTDCNDNNAAISPGAAEICGDGIDNNCDNNESYPSQYRSAVATGDWSDASTWEKYCNAGGSWTAAQIAPSNQYFNASVPFAVTVQSGHVVTVSTTSTTDFAKAGSLSVAGDLIVNGNLTVTSSVINSGNVTINHGASFVQSSENTTNSGNGNFIVNMNLTGASNGTAPTGRYWYLGSPMNNTVASLFFDQPKMVRLWIYEPSNNSWVTLINSSTTASGATNSTLLVPGMGYLYRAGSDKTIQFTGDATKFNNNITTPLSFTGTGYKYVANPYTSHIDWRLVTRTGLNVSYWIRNATNTAYEAYNATSGVSTPTGTQTTQFIPPMQGFWVYAYTTPCSLRMDNGDRTHSTNGLHAPEYNQIVRLNLNDGKTDDQAVVYENENASNGIEEYDTDKFMDENHHQVYFLEGTKQLTLDGLKDATAKQRVDMGIQITSAGTYTINAVELGVEEDVMLEDKFTHTYQDLKRNNTYSFTTNAGTYNNRFVLHFTVTPSTETAIETEAVGVTETVGETEGVNIYTTTGQTVKVWVTNTAEFQNATVKVYDAVGNMIERKNMTSNELLLDLNTATGVYLVEVTGAEKTFTKKVFVTK